MTATTPATLRIRFADFEADLRSQELFRDGALVRLPNQSFLALAALLERPGELVTRDQLRERLWPDNRVVEFEQGLNAIINRLREALGDNAENPRFIETLPRRGYRFIGTLEPAATLNLESAEAPPEPPASRGFPWRVVVGAVLAVCISAVLLIPAKRELPAAAAASVLPLTTLLGEERMPGFSPDGEQVVFAWNGVSGEARGFDLFLRAVNSERMTQLTNSPAAALAGSWSPDGTLIAFTRMGGNGGVFAIASTGGVERRLIDASFTQESLMQPAWSPDGAILAYSAVNSQGSHSIRLLTLQGLISLALEPAPSCWHAGAPGFSPDGKQLAFLCMTSVAVYGVYVAELGANAAPREIARMQGLPQGLAWASASRILVANDSGDGGGVWEVELDGTLHKPKVAEEAMGFGVSARNGRVVYARARQVIDIWHVKPDATMSPPARKWIFSTRAQMTPQYSPDGARIAFQSNRSGSPEIWIADADGRNAARLTTVNGPLTGAPAWCSDGRRLAFDSRASGVSAVYVVDTLERTPRRVAASPGNLALPVWSRDCRWLLASDGREALYRVAADGGEAQRFTQQRSYQAAVVGDRVVFNVAEPAGVSLWIKPLTGGEETALPGLPRLAYADSWAANDEAIYFTDTRRVPVAVLRYDLATAKTQSVATLPNSPTPLGGLGLAVLRDGSSLLYTHTEDTQSDLVLLVLLGTDLFSDDKSRR
jgi:Tol biopolymer transport system component/DNA-binding winged helix-turn-helix (wHTH) protein